MIELYSYLLLFLTIIMIIILYPESSSLPSLRTSLLAFSGGSLSPSAMLLLLIIDLFCIPIILITIFLSNFGKYMFNNIKDMRKSYRILLNCLIASYLQCTIYTLFSFIISISSSKEKYFELRCLNNISYQSKAHKYTMRYILSLITYSTSFIVLFFWFKLNLLNKLAFTPVSQARIALKYSKTYKIVAGVVIFNICIMIFISNNFSDFCYINKLCSRPTNISMNDLNVKIIINIFLNIYLFEIYISEMDEM